MMKYAVAMNAPVAIRYPRGEAYAGLREFRAPIELGKAELLYAEGDVCLLALGSMVITALQVREQLKQHGIKCSIINARFAKPIDGHAVEWAARNHALIVTMEENVANGGYGEQVRDVIDTKSLKVRQLLVALPDDYVEHGNVDILKREVGIDADTITAKIRKEFINPEK